MAKESVEKEINGLKFTIVPLAPMRALKLLTRIGKIVGPALAQAATALQGKNLADADLSAFSGAVQLLFDKLTPDEFEAVIRQLFAGTLATINPDKPGVDCGDKFDLVFERDLSDVFTLAAAVIGVNYGGFLGVFGKLAAPYMAQAKAKAEASPSPND